MRIDTDRYIVCSNGSCGNVEHFGNVTSEEAKQLARKYGWKPNKGEPICPECIVQGKTTTESSLGFKMSPGTGAESI